MRLALKATYKVTMGRDIQPSYWFLGASSSTWWAYFDQHGAAWCLKHICQDSCLCDVSLHFSPSCENPLWYAVMCICGMTVDLEARLRQTSRQGLYGTAASWHAKYANGTVSFSFHLIANRMMKWWNDGSATLLVHYFARCNSWLEPTLQ